jgi:hypothetical protein
MISIIVFYAVICTALSLFYEFSTREGMLLHNWYLWIERLTTSPRTQGLFEILGGCIYCNNPYLTAGFLMLFAETREFITTLSFVCIIALNHLFLRLWHWHVDD